MKKSFVIMAAATILASMASMAKAATMEELQQQVDELRSQVKAIKAPTTVSIKADYQLYDDHRAAGETPLDNDKLQVTVGFVF